MGLRTTRPPLNPLTLPYDPHPEPSPSERSGAQALRLYIPLMASCSYGQIGALNAESFCERVLRCAGHVLTEGNSVEQRPRR